MAAIMTSNQPTKTYISDDDNYIAPRQRSDYSRSSSREKHRKPKKSSRRKDYSSSERSSSRGSSLERDLNKIKIRDDYVTIPVKAHEPKKVVLRKKQNESFGMKLGTRVFVQGLTSNGLAMNEGLNNEDLILSINGNSTDSMTIPEVLSQLVNVDTVELEVQQVTGGTVTLPADVLNGLGESSRDSKADSKRSKNKKHKKKNRRSASEEDHYRRTDRYNDRYDDRYDDRYNSSRHHDRSRDYNDPYVSQKSTHV